MKHIDNEIIALLQRKTSDGTTMTAKQICNQLHSKYSLRTIQHHLKILAAPEGAQEVISSVGPYNAINYNINAEAVSHIHGEQMTVEERNLLHSMLEEFQCDKNLENTARSLQKKLLAFTDAKGEHFLDFPSNDNPTLFKSPTPNQELIVRHGLPRITQEQTEENLKQIFTCIRQNTVCDILYNQSVKEQKKTIECLPILIFKADDGYYISVIKTQDNSYRQLTAGQIVSITERPEISYEVPQDIDIHAQTKDPFGFILDHEEFEAVIRLDDWQGWYAAQIDWPKGCSIAYEETNTYLLKVRTRSEWGLCNWLYKQVWAAEVLEPAWLKQKMIYDFKWALRIYKSGILNKKTYYTKTGKIRK